jgi:TPR repeat protein
LLLDGELLISPAELEARLGKSKRKDHEVRFVLSQSKTSDGYSAADLSHVGVFTHSLFTNAQKNPSDERLQELLKCSNLVTKNIGKLRDGRPYLDIFFCTTGKFGGEAPLNNAIDSSVALLNSTGLFKSITYRPLDRDALVELWTESRKRFQARLEECRLQPFKTIPGVDESYVAIVPAKNLVDGLLRDPASSQIRRSVFDQNVRAYLSAKNETNAQIRASLQSPDRRNRFALLNNGVTIVSRDIKVQGDSVVLDSPQIVNGCQTCSVIFDESATLDPQVYVVCKLIETSNMDILTEIIEATNSQTAIDKNQLLAAMPSVQRIARFFDALPDGGEAQPKLFFERRTNQYADENNSPKRVFDIDRLARAYAAMFLDQPHDAARYPTQMIKQLGSKIFNEDADPILFYIAALTLYRVELALGNNYIDRKLQSAKWHLLMAMKYQNAGQKTTPGQSAFPNKARDALQKALSDSGKASSTRFKAGIDALLSMKWTRDILRSEKFTDDMKKKLIK